MLSTSDAPRLSRSIMGAWQAFPIEAERSSVAFDWHVIHVPKLRFVNFVVHVPQWTEDEWFAALEEGLKGTALPQGRACAEGSGSEITCDAFSISFVLFHQRGESGPSGRESNRS